MCIFEPIKEPITDNCKELKTIMPLNHNVDIVYIPRSNRFSVGLEDITGSSQFPIMVNGLALYDFPERVSDEQKAEVYKAFRILGHD